MDERDEIRAVLGQWLRTEQLLGIRSLPIPREQPRDLVPDSRPLPPAATSLVRDSHLTRSPSFTPLEPIDPGEKSRRLRALDETHVKGCRKCGLCETRTQTVFGQGSAAARLVFVGEAPGFEEDKQGKAFVGRAGQLLTKMIEAMGVTRDDVFICNVLKCRPPNNREPAADEILACHPYLKEQLCTIPPEVIVALGAPAAKTLLNTAQSIGKLRGRFHDYFFSGTTGEGPSVPLMPTYHPAYLLRNPDDKRKTWEDLKLVMALMGLGVKAV